MRRQAQSSHLRAFSGAVAILALATAARYALTPLVGETGLPYLTYFPAIAAVGWIGSVPLALFATVSSAAIANLLFVPPAFGIVLTLPTVVSLLAFIVTGGAIALLTARLEAAAMESAARARQADERAAALEVERENLQRESRRLRLLADVSTMGVANATFLDVAQHAVRRLAEEIGDASVVRLLDGEQLNAIAWHHVESEARPLLEAALLKPDAAAKDPRYRHLLESRKTFTVSDLPIPGLDALAPERKALLLKYRPRHAMGTPLIVRDQVVGTLTALRSQPTPYSDADLITIEAVASRVSLALENARLFDDARRKAEEAQRARTVAEEASRVKDEFLATLSHELRTPLNAIVGWAHMLRDHDLPDERRRSAVDTILRNARSQEQLIADILDVQRIMAGKLRLNVRSVDMSGVVRAAADTVRPSAEAKQIKLQLLLDLDVTSIWGDPDRLQQVTWNLLSNAIKFTPVQGRVQVRLLQTDDDCLMVIEDNGPGIAPEFLPHVFERFRQADSSPTRVHKGLGLGLAITRNLVEMHGGSIDAANMSEDGRTGAVFTVRLPRQQARIPISPELEAPGDDGDAPRGHLPADLSLAGTRVLVVDDDEDARQIVESILGRYGAKVVVASSADEGLRALERNLPDVVVTDIEMPHQDGYTFIRRIRALPEEAGGRLPAAALTAYASASDRVRLLSAGFNIHVPKPVRPTELVTVIASLTRSRSQKQLS